MPTTPQHIFFAVVILIMVDENSEAVRCVIISTFLFILSPLCSPLFFNTDLTLGYVQSRTIHEVNYQSK